MKATSKLFQATEIVKASSSKAEALADIMNQLGVSKANAFVYYTKATKGQQKPEKTTEKTSEKTVSKTSVSMTSATKKAAKLAEIDKFLASAPSAAGNPFAALA